MSGIVKESDLTDFQEETSFIYANGDGEYRKAMIDEVSLAFEATLQMNYERIWPQILVPLIREGRGKWFRDGVEIDEPKMRDMADVSWVCVFEKG